ncbi:hypothetical protein HNY73_015630 [Argiope bruennichi]|uniref:Uncharacterized protein n=1 Tax=Argiope bruennichi TaxID=94029 RepID=A0A8T0EX52_ARGBR|nr:hypothetical protein HNY73_015630 [Argiope bruennichi]
MPAEKEERFKAATTAKCSEKKAAVQVRKEEADQEKKRTLKTKEISDRSTLGVFWERTRATAVLAGDQQSARFGTPLAEIQGRVHVNGREVHHQTPGVVMHKFNNNLMSNVLYVADEDE